MLARVESSLAELRKAGLKWGGQEQVGRRFNSRD